jgi:hypothetical protein
MNLTDVQSQAITARMALIVGTITFDRLFPASSSAKLMVIFFVYAKNEECAAEMEDSFALHISVIAATILDREIGIVMVLPKFPPRSASS